MKLTKVPKSEEGHRQTHENVTDMKCAIILSAPVGKFGYIKVNLKDNCSVRVLRSGTSFIVMRRIQEGVEAARRDASPLLPQKYYTFMLSLGSL